MNHSDFSRAHAFTLIEKFKNFSFPMTSFDSDEIKKSAYWRSSDQSDLYVFTYLNDYQNISLDNVDCFHAALETASPFNTSKEELQFCAQVLNRYPPSNTSDIIKRYPQQNQQREVMRIKDILDRRIFALNAPIDTTIEVIASPLLSLEIRKAQTSVENEVSFFILKTDKTLRCFRGEVAGGPLHEYSSFDFLEILKTQAQLKDFRQIFEQHIEKHQLQQQVAMPQIETKNHFKI